MKTQLNKNDFKISAVPSHRSPLKILKIQKIQEKFSVCFIFK